MLTPEQLEVAANIIAPGQGDHGPMTYVDLVEMWDDEDILAPTEEQLTIIWRGYALSEAIMAISNKGTELIKEVTGDVPSQLNQLMRFSLLMYGWLKGDPTAEGQADAVYGAMVPPIVAIQTHQAQLLALLNDSTLDSLDIESGTIDGLASGWT